MGTKRFHTDCPIPNCYTYYPKKKERILKRNKKENLQKISLIYLVYQIKHSILKLLIFFHQNLRFILFGSKQIVIFTVFWSILIFEQKICYESKNPCKFCGKKLGSVATGLGV